MVETLSEFRSGVSLPVLSGRILQNIRRRIKKKK
jgi:hypothetical protein